MNFMKILEYSDTFHIKMRIKRILTEKQTANLPQFLLAIVFDMLLAKFNINFEICQTGKNIHSD